MAVSTFLIFCLQIHLLLGCDQAFEGFGVFLGSNRHLSRSSDGIENKVMDAVYNKLGVRLFRTSYEEHFSPSPDKYEITCRDKENEIFDGEKAKVGFTCSWIKLHRYLSNLPDVKVFASIWSPPHHLKTGYNLPAQNEEAFLHFIKNITFLMERDYNIKIEKVSPVNEPENILAPWDHLNVSPRQLCRIVKGSHDPLLSLCPENAYFWVSRVFQRAQDAQGYNCASYCDTLGTHAYRLNLDITSPNRFLAYYDLQKHTNRGTDNPIWMTEVSSTYKNAEKTQMKEGLDLATNIMNFVGTTCVQRYYFWYSYTLGASGESLIWGDDQGNLRFPKKFYIYKLFIEASKETRNGAIKIEDCTEPFSYMECIKFGDANKIFMNKQIDRKEVGDGMCKRLCCTNEDNDEICYDDGMKETNVIPGMSVCHCVLNKA